MIRSTGTTAIEDRALTAADLADLDTELDTRGFRPANPGLSVSSARRRAHPWGGVEVWTWISTKGRIYGGVLYDPGAEVWPEEDHERFTSLERMRDLLDEAGVFPRGGAR